VAPEAAAVPRVRLGPLLRPREHGVYPLWTEPVLLGLLLAPSLAGVAIAVAAAAAVVAQQPAALGMADLRRGRRYPRTGVALRAAGLLAVGAAALLAAAAVLAPASPGPGAWYVALLVAGLPAGVQLAADRRLQGATLRAQLAGAVALAGLAPAVALAGGAAPAVAWTAGGLLALRAGASIPTVRARLRRARGRPAAVAPAWTGAALLAAGAALAAATGLVTAWAAAVGVALAARAALSLRSGAVQPAPVRVGVAETLAGLVWVAALAFGGLAPAA
jgi:hypothetical protein